MNRTTRRTPLIFWLAAFVLGAAALPVTATSQSRPIVIRAGEIHTVTNGVIEDGEILLRDGVIEQVGPSVDAPPPTHRNTTRKSSFRA